MVLIKTLLTGLAGVSLSMANISGIVTDTGTTPISGAVVQLEKGGQTATTESDGRFTIMVSTAILPGNRSLLPNGLSAKISNNKLTMTIPDWTAVEVTTFDLIGKALSTVRRPMNAGTHFIALTYQGAGIYLYKVKAGNNEFVLKGNSAGWASSGNVVSSQSSSSNSPAKQAKVTAAINDVIAATKTGYLNYRCVQYNSDTTGIQIKMIASAGTVTDTEGNAYQTVRIGNQVWMAENLRVTKYNDGSAIPKVTDSVAWYAIYSNNLSTPAYCYYNNTTNADSIKKFGALYNWYVVDTKKLAPAGWHVPADSEWIIMEKYLVLHGFNWDGTTDTLNYNAIAKSLAAKAYWLTNQSVEAIGCNLTKNNNSGFSAIPGGCRGSYAAFSGQGRLGYWRSATEGNASSAFSRWLSCDNGGLGRSYESKSEGFSVRLIRDN